MLSIFFSEDGDGMFLRNAGIYLRVYTVSKPEEHYHLHRRENLKSHNYKVIQKSLCTYKNTDIFLMVILYLRLQVTKQWSRLQSRDTNKSRALSRGCVCTGTSKSSWRLFKTLTTMKTVEHQKIGWGKSRTEANVRGLQFETGKEILETIQLDKLQATILATQFLADACFLYCTTIWKFC
jgi:hypothetical protein